ncbi:hypothetical protein PILCRDRAFT_616536 [Piloderma croceum F 1598]|uniref:Uncharacterized protein n=1 Tax=Piloderma croceum (strain F 1598) TaxID=765440 RepID=A0A0C3EY98_PILCF|nr:hypothetical protein PILCRDRAFT_616536 [Piloderma croceum F 1598]
MRLSYSFLSFSSSFGVMRRILSIVHSPLFSSSQADSIRGFLWRLPHFDDILSETSHLVAPHFGPTICVAANLIC